MREARWPGAVGVILAVGLVLTLVLGRSSEAAWTATSEIPGTAINTGSVDLRVSGALPDTDHLVPGDRVTAGLVVTNSGSVPASYTIAVSGGDADGKHLADALVMRLRGSGCGAELGDAARPLAPGASESVCLELALPASAPASLADGATTVTVTASAADHAWSDSVQLPGARLSTATLTAPTLTCGSGLLGQLTVRWSAVPGATAYRIHYGPTGALVDTVPAGTLSRVFTGVAGVVSVQAVFGSDDWVSPRSDQLLYSALGGLSPTTCS